MDPEFAVLLSTMVRRALVSANTLIKLGARKPLSNRFIDKLRHKNSGVYEIKAQVDGRLIVE